MADCYLKSGRPSRSGEPGASASRTHPEVWTRTFDVQGGTLSTGVTTGGNNSEHSWSDPGAPGTAVATFLATLAHENREIWLSVVSPYPPGAPPEMLCPCLKPRIFPAPHIRAFPVTDTEINNNDTKTKTDNKYLKFVNSSRRWCHAPLVPATWEAKTGDGLGFGVQGQPG